VQAGVKGKLGRLLGIFEVRLSNYQKMNNIFNSPHFSLGSLTIKANVILDVNKN